MSWFTGGERSAATGMAVIAGTTMTLGISAGVWANNEYDRVDTATYQTDAVATTMLVADRQHAEIDTHLGLGPGFITDTLFIERAQYFPSLEIPLDPGWILHGLRLSGVLGNYPVEDLRYFDTRRPFDDYHELAEYIVGISGSSESFATDRDVQEALGRVTTALYVQSQGGEIPEGSRFVVADNVYQPVSADGVVALELDCSRELSPKEQLQATPPSCVLVASN